MKVLMEQTELNDKEFSKYFSRIKEENWERSLLLTLEEEFYKLSKSLTLRQIRSIQLVFLNKINPLLFCQITDKEFKRIFGGIFLNTKFYLNSISTIIQFIGYKNDNFCFSKVICIFESIQLELFQRLLLLENEDLNEDILSIDQFTFILSSYPDRIHNFVGRTGGEFPSSTICTFENNLLEALIKVLLNGNFNVELFTKIIFNYSIEFFDRFLSKIIFEEDSYHSLQRIFTFDKIEKRKREAILIRLIQFIPDGKTLEKLFGNSPLSDQLLRKCLLEKSIFINSNSSIRNSKKSAEFFSILGQNCLIEVFNQLINQFCAQSQILSIISLQNQFNLSLAVIDFARQINKEIRPLIRDDLTNSLINVFPRLLEQPEISRRQIGMFTAETIFNLFEHPSPLKFDYIQTDPVLCDFINALKGNEIEKMEEGDKKSEEKPQFSSFQQKKHVIDPRVSILDSDDDEEENVPILIKNVKINEEKLSSSFPYIQDCLSALKDEKTEFRHWEEALLSIGPLIKKKSIGLNILGIEILETLIFLEERFKLDNFRNIKIKIISFLLADNPQLISHFNRLFCSKKCSQSHKFLLISSIVNAAKLLYYGDENGENIKKEENEKELKEKKENKQIGKIIWRSTNLNSKQQIIKTSKFAPVASQFIFSLLDLCQKYSLNVCNLKKIIFKKYFRKKDFNILANLIGALGEVINISKFSPSIIRIASSTFLFLQQFRYSSQLQNVNFLILNNLIFCYLSLFELLEISLLKEQFSNELIDIFEWIGIFKEKEQIKEQLEINKSLNELINLFLFKLNEILF
uniref:Telomere length regulation protein conserved domain-containing protein n=1 Tax=Meloidogyne enterolobii TaxID=390850 RepID=A0A6V7V350_MELEN|nr:unnamed protein product [Meloidogyne enterolobii]